MELSNNNTQRTLQYVQSKKGSSTVYIQGLISLAVFVVSSVIAATVYIPYISETADIVKQRVAIEKDVVELQKKFDTISGYPSDVLNAELSAVTPFIPDQIRVAQLATFINTNAVNYNLSVSRIGINENQSEIKQLDTKEQQKLLGSNKTEKKIYMGRVEGPFSFKGTREDIFKFLDFLVIGGYATNFDQVTVNASDTIDGWTVSFFASYYYLEPLVDVEPGRVLQLINKSALKPITVVTPIVFPSEPIPPIFTPTPTSSVTPSPIN